MRKFYGYTLVEMCVVIAMLSVMLGLAAGLIHSLLGTDKMARETLEHQTAAAALAETFRGDIHASATLTPATTDNASPPRQWELKGTNGAVVVYRLEKSELVRESKTANRSARESFPLPAGATVTIETHRQGEATLVTLAVEPGPTATGAPGRTGTGLWVEARLGRDRWIAEMPLRSAPGSTTANSVEEPTNE